MARASLGNSAVPPVRVCPFCAVSRLVPSLAISASSPAWEDWDRPSTAVIAATPIAIPRADNAARSFLVRNPTLASRARSAARSRAGAGACGRPAAGRQAVMTFLPTLALGPREAGPGRHR